MKPPNENDTENTKEIKLSVKHKAFADKYLLLMNGTKAYMEVYKDASYETAMVNSSKLLRNAKVKEYLNEKFDEYAMSVEEALKRTADIANADLGDFVNDFGMIDISQARKEGKTRLIKKLQTKTVIINGKQEDKEIHTQTIELYPADAAHDKILRAHGRYRDVGSEGNPHIVHVKKIGVDLEDL